MQWPYRHAADLEWSQAELPDGKLIKIKSFPGAYRVKLFRVVLSWHRAHVNLSLKEILREHGVIEE